jgi:hypothetical protein
MIISNKNILSTTALEPDLTLDYSERDCNDTLEITKGIMGV